MLFSPILSCSQRFLMGATLALAFIAGVSAARADTLTGTALIRERIALPPDVVFEAVIEDIARADAPAIPLARTVIESPGQSPIGFSIDYDPDGLDPRATYALRATIRQDGQLLFSSDTVTRVLQDGQSQDMEVLLKRVRLEASAEGAPLPAHGLRLPATFSGTLPCADCDGIRHHLDLWPDQYYHLRQDWLGKEDALRRDEIGRWYADPVRDAIVLYGASEMPVFWQVQGPDRLRRMDMAGNPIISDLDYALTGDGTLAPTPLEGMFLLGRMTYMADAALFEECLSGVRYPIVQEGEYLALERAYLAATPSPGAPVVVHVEGGLEMRPAMEGPPRTQLIVHRFIATRSDDACTRPEPQASLTDTYWRIDSLLGQETEAVANRREPHIVLQSGPDRRFRATVGCNQIIGSYDTDSDALTFGPGASTQMACPPPLDTLERQVHEMLGATRRFRQQGQSLLLEDASGASVASLTAVYLR